MTKDIYSFCEMSGHTNEFYLRPEEDERVYFDIHTAGHLLKCEAILQALMENGIHCWEYYDSAMKQFEKEWKV